MFGVMIGDKHTYKDWGLILANKSISPPVPQTKMVSVPMRDGSIDLTRILADDVKYNDRIITLNFTVVDNSQLLENKISDIANYCHGKKFRIICDDDNSFYYDGRVAINEWASNRKKGTLVIECIVEPFKYSLTSSSINWEWDVFDFENGILNDFGELIVEDSVTITLICSKKRMFPTFTASADMTVTFEGETYSLKAGSQKIYDVFLVEGENELTFTGNGTISIDYIWGSL